VSLPTLRLSWRYLAHHRLRTAILVVCVAIVFFLPLAVSFLIGHYEAELTARAARVPLVVGAKGSRYDLVLNSLYFKGRIPDDLSMAEATSLSDTGLATAVPLVVKRTAKGCPVVGTTLDYFEALSLSVAEGTLPVRLGDAVVGAAVARDLGLRPGTGLVTDVDKLYDISSTYPLRLRVTGVLAESRSPDDLAVFVDVKTAWVVEGLGHGHVQPVEVRDESGILARREGEVVFNDSIVKYIEITPENIDSFHFHGDPATFPLTAILAWPRDPKSGTILKGRYAVSETAQMLTPSAVVAELLGFVFRVKRFFDANFVLVTAATALFLTLIVLLTLRIRQREILTLTRIGCSRFTVLRLQATELFIVLATGALLAGAIAGVLVTYAVRTHLVF
jgi:putative ABC transport system permease protein